MKYNFENLFFAKCRHCIMDILNVTDDNGNLMIPHPDYVDYYTILLFKNGKFINLYDKHINYISVIPSNCNEHYFEEIILEKNNLSEYVDYQNKRISFKECNDLKNTILNKKKLNIKYGYKNNI